MARWSRGSRYGGYGAWAPKQSVGERRASAARTAAALRKKGQRLSPVVPEAGGRALATTFWGKAWCDNLERYSDYESRLPRGRSYLRSGSVIDLQIAEGRVTALVQGSSMYKVTIAIDAVPAARWKALIAQCAGGIDSVVALLQGKLSGAVMEAVTRERTGLFPEPERLKMGCSCPDWATMCKHVAAVLYGIGVRLDSAPELLFRLRGTDPAELTASAARSGALGGKAVAKEKVLGGADLASVFGIEMDPAPTPAPEPALAAPPAGRPRAKKANGAVDTSTKRVTKAAPTRRKAATVARAHLLQLGVTPATLQRWLRDGVLLPTSTRGVYEKTDEGRLRIEAYEEA